MFDSVSTPEKSSSAARNRHEARTEAILRAALEELAAVGYSAFSFESVAARVGIAKTTAYRRYPTKIDLVRAAMRQFVDRAAGEPPDTGSLRGDLIVMGRLAIELSSSIFGQAMFRMRLLERVAPELEQLGREFDSEHEDKNRLVAARAVARGELASEADFEVLVQLLVGAIMFKLVVKQQSVTELEVAHIVDMLLNGVSRPALRGKHGQRG